MPTRTFIVISILLMLIAPVRAEDTFGAKIKKIFATPTPTPRPRKKKTETATKKTSPTPTPAKKSSPKQAEETPTPSPKKKKSPVTEDEQESPSPTPRKKKTSAAEQESESPSPSPKKKKTAVKEEEAETSPTPKKKKSSPTPSPTASASPHKKKKGSPTPEPFETPTPTPAPAETPSPTETPDESASPSQSPKKHRAANATLTPDEIKGFENYPAGVQKLLSTALELTTHELVYKYGSADPADGGMDCSGFVYYVLRQNGMTDVPRDSSGQYVWLRRARTFEPVISEKDDSFELENLKPGDLLFWTGTYSIDRDPPITHAMIYVGREKKSGQRVMVGSSDGRVYQGESRNGVSVFDFKVQRRAKADDGRLHPTFVGYGHLPGMQE